MFQNFIVSGFGRSGTSFLVKVCNLSKQWKVFHEFHSIENASTERLLGEEPVEPDCLTYSTSFLDKIEQRLSQDFIGNVNGYLRYHLDYFQKVKYIGVIHRDPRDIMVSIVNKHPKPSTWLSYAAELVHYHKWFTENIKWVYRYEIIDFKQMVSDKEYLVVLLQNMGVVDVEVTELLLNTKVNTTSHPICTSYHELPREVRWVIDSIV